MITIAGKIYDGISMKPELDDALEHYGVRGMRWGHRKAQLRGMGLSRKQARRVVRLEKEQNRFQKAIDNGRGTDFDRQGVRDSKRAINDIMRTAKSSKQSKAIRSAKKANAEVKSIQSSRKPMIKLKTREYEPMKIDKSDSSVTKKVKKDFNDMNDTDFFSKYGATKKTYQKRVKKYGDPYKHATRQK